MEEAGSGETAGVEKYLLCVYEDLNLDLNTYMKPGHDDTLRRQCVESQVEICTSRWRVGTEENQGG